MNIEEKQKSLIHLRSGILGWKDGTPIPKPICIILNTMCNKKPFMSHVMVLARKYETVGEAKRAGWTMPAKPGLYKTKRDGRPSRPVVVV